MDSGVRVLRFWTEYRLKEGTHVPRDMVEFCSVGMADKATTVASVASLSRLRPIADPQNDIAAVQAHMIWDAIRPSYEAWKSGQEAPENGTPLGAWPAIDPLQANVLRTNGIRSVEDVAALTDSMLSKIPLPNARYLQEQAKGFLSARDKASVVQALQDKDLQIAELRSQVDELVSLIKGAEPTEEAPKRRGRKPKVREMPEMIEALEGEAA